MADENQRVVLLNWMTTKSVTRDKSDEVKEELARLHSARDLLRIVGLNLGKPEGIEYIGATEKERENPAALNLSEYHLIRLRSFAIKDDPGRSYAELLVEYIDKSVRGFNVVDFNNFDGREISGTDSERGAYCAHAVVQLPADNGYDDGSYRCVIEAGTPISRKDIETFIAR